MQGHTARLEIYCCRARVEVNPRGCRALGKLSCEKSGNVNKNATYVERVLRLAFLTALKYVNFTRPKSSLGNSPAKQVKISAKRQNMYAGEYALTVEAHVAQVETLELGKDCHVRCNGPAQLVLTQVEIFEIC